jgi:hypothetical protein
MSEMSRATARRLHDRITALKVNMDMTPEFLKMAAWDEVGDLLDRLCEALERGRRGEPVAWIYPTRKGGAPR